MKKNWKEIVFIVCVAFVAYIAGAVEVKYQDSKDTITATKLITDYAKEEYGDICNLEVGDIEKNSKYSGDWVISYMFVIDSMDGRKARYCTTSVDYMLSRTGNKDKKIVFCVEDNQK